MPAQQNAAPAEGGAQGMLSGIHIARIPPSNPAIFAIFDGLLRGAVADFTLKLFCFSLPANRKQYG